MMRPKLLYRIDGCVWSYQSYDDGAAWVDEPVIRIDAEKHQVGETQLLIYIYVHVYILPYFHQNKMIKFLGPLLQCIGQNICMNFIELDMFNFNNCRSIVYSYFVLMIVSMACNYDTFFSPYFLHELLLNSHNPFTRTKCW